MKKKTIKIILLLLLLILPFSCTFYFLEYKIYHTIGNITFTFWNVPNGYCYIMPYKYKGLLLPKKDYIRVHMGDDIRIFVGDGIVYVFSHRVSIFPHNYFSSDESKYKVFGSKFSDIGRTEAWEHCKKMNYPNVLINTYGINTSDMKSTENDF
ncbi:hypothetical protein [Treponema pedis]|uniref:hypothetical protein n=1 Tax=Treponema pedis TaxID=409322 RepID=UPI000466F433|nr:hypothetical protein [Treponema pedis]